MAKQVERIIFLSLYIYIAIKACVAFQKVAVGTGNVLSQYSPVWGLAFVLIILFSIFFLTVIVFLFWKPILLEPILINLANIREKFGIFRWVIAFLFLISIGWFLQYTVWGLVFRDIYLRIFLWGCVLIFLTIFLTKGSSLFQWNAFVSAVILTSAEFIILQALLNVNDYPFSLGWSEGNRMWDYSILFGRELYDYPLDQPIPVLLDIGRQFIGGIPFLISGVTIEMERFWVGVTLFLSNLLVGITLFRFNYKKPALWVLSILWAMIFLKQGFIHPPLVVSAAIVALLWRFPLWLAIPLIALTGYFTEESRFTWLFAPGMWIAMLELVDSNDEKLSRQTWIRTISLGLSGIIGGYFGDKIVGILQGNAEASVAISIEGIAGSVESQPLLWYRLLPNATYGIGILAGLLIAILPLVIVIIYLVNTKKVKFNVWQSLIILGTLSAFFIVGIIVSTKIGGGGDLHNMDMFLIGLMFLSAIVWRKGGEEWFKEFSQAPMFVKMAFILMFVIPGIQPLSSLRTYEYFGNPKWLFVLTDAKTTRELDLLPQQDAIDNTLQTIQEEIALAKQNGEVLFIDQRQLLTFGYISDVPFVPEYEKKILMNEALSSSMIYFTPFYEDLANKRFSLIISEPLKIPIQDSTYRFGEENNAWVTWVSTPILCYYEEKILFKEIGIQLLIPKEGIIDCTSQLP